MTRAVEAPARGGRRLSRVTLVGEHRRVDLVVPADEPVGALLPDVLRLLDDRPRPAGGPLARRLVTADGAVLPQDATLAAVGVEDGAVLRLVRQEETPAAPVVHDVADAAAEDVEQRAWRWRDERVRAWATGAATLTLGLVAAVLARDWYGTDAVGPWLVAVALAAAVAGVAATRLGGGQTRGEAGAVLLLLAGALGAFGAWALTDGGAGGATGGGADGAVRLAAVGGVGVGLLVLLGVFTALGRSAYVGAGIGLVLLGGWVAALALTDRQDAALGGVVLGTASVLALGLLPRYALMTAGLTRLDDERAGGASVSRHRVDVALAAAHRGLALATVTVAASAAMGGWLALGEPGRPGGDGGPTGWTVWVTVLLAVVLLSRARACPLAVEVAALLAAGAVLVVRLVVVWAEETGEPAGPLVVACAVAAVPLVLNVVRPADHVRVRLRRIVNLAEAVAVVVLVPVAIGAFGVYGRLLDTF
ncbi:type VII secretion integral membrane protein EccD [Streptomyces sp. 4N509B]|uniref:type VII secretion integral membrane protein EccD n=1 Tax=Streptomyces sp. 4N509B TaxID=3457413 RepID=UPI003FD5F824